ncbi:MAG: S9 family peptidase [Pseudomonadota bacterium]|nr:S9 family peptidase [Pseudomonadota bacterium]
MLIARLLIAAAFFAGQAAAQPSLITVDDIHRIADLSEPVFSPDGSAVYYTVSTHNLKADETVSDIWRVGPQGGEPENVTGTTGASEWRAQLSADGAWLAYLSDAGKAETAQVWIRRTKGGKARQVTHAPGGVSDFALSPDGGRLLFIAETGAGVGVPDGETAPPIVIDRFKFKEDYRGYLADNRQHVFLAGVKDGKAFQLTSGAFDHWMPGWSPDGALISFVSKRRADPDRNNDYDVFVMPPEPGAEPRPLGDYVGADNDVDFESRPAWSPDSKRLAWVRFNEDKWIYYSPSELVVGDVETGETRDVARVDRWFYSPQWSADGKALYALVEGDSVMHLARIDLATDAVEELTEGPRYAYGFAIGPEDERIVLDGDPSRPYELRALGPAPRALTHHNDWLDGRRLGRTSPVSATSGGVEIHGLLVTPPDYDGSSPLPLIVRVHGGPVYQFSNEFMFDWQVYAAHGYAVLGVNPRGSSGRGFDFARAIYADWGNADVKDVHALADEVVRMGVGDGDRMGVGGWSYGGILTDYLIASDARFRAAVSGAGMANFLGGYGADQYAREYEFELGQPWRDFKTWRKVSYPFYEADRIKTPTLFVCAAADMNVPCIGSEQMYQALRSLDIETRLVIYPGENHGLTVPSYLADRMQRSLDWYDAHLKAR